MLKMKEEDLDFFEIANRNRFSPDNVKIFFLGVFIYTSIPMFIVFLGFLLNGDKIFLSPFEKKVLLTELNLYVLEFVFLMLYMFPKVAFKLQKLQAIVMLFYSFQIATLPFMVMVVGGIFDFSYNNKTLVYIGLILLWAICIHIVETIDVFKRAKHGGYKLEGGAVSFFTKATSYLWTGMIIYVVVLLVLIFININYAFDDMEFYVVQTIILYIFAIESAEFVLLAYCRFKFPSFNITWEEHEKRRQERLKLYKKREKKKKKKNISVESMPRKTKKKSKKHIYIILFILLIIVPTVGQGLIDRQLLRNGEHKQAVMINKTIYQDTIFRKNCLRIMVDGKLEEIYVGDRTFKKAEMGDIFEVIKYKGKIEVNPKYDYNE